MRIVKQLLSGAVLFFAFSVSAHACFSCKKPPSCPPGTPDCEQTEDYYGEFITTDIDKGLFNKYYFDFDPITAPGEGFEITKATLTVETNSNGKLDSIWALDPISFVGSLNDTDTSLAFYKEHPLSTQEFALSSSLFDEIMDGIMFKAWFGNKCEKITWAKLTVEGIYCPSTPVPVPAAAFLFAPALLGLVGLGKRKKAEAA